jgi:hypothetical protein
MYALLKRRYHLVWTEMRELLWLFSATTALSVGAVGVGATFALVWDGLSPWR